tara:strand:+ start:661 stop:900 length:240 start_codon:yes stop_codon:yes gene_type:complete
MSTTATTYETSEQYRKMSIQIRDLQLEVEDLTLDVDEGRVLLARSNARNRKLTEQLRVKSVGVPFAPTPDQMAAFADSD